MLEIQWKLETHLTSCIMPEALVSNHAKIYEDETHETGI